MKYGRAILLAVACALMAVPAGQAKQAKALRSLSDMHVGSSKSELVAQRDYSTHVIHWFYSARHRWMMAPRHASCWSHVAWSQTCNRARRQVARHRTLLSIANFRLERLHKAEAAQQQLALEQSGDVGQIIDSVFGGYSGQARVVASCESGWRTSAVNGQYHGIFQMGSNERARYATIGYSTAYEQVVAAHNYFVAAHGWGPWQCQP